MTELNHDRIECVPCIHGRLAFAVEARRRMLEHRYDAIAVELPASLSSAVDSALDLFPVASVVLYRDAPEFIEDAPSYYVPVQPADAMIEALRVARGERIPTFFVDADVHDFQSNTVVLPDPHVLHTVGLEAYFDVCGAALAEHPRSDQDRLRETHMAARLQELLDGLSGRILFLCGMAHWLPIRQHLRTGSGELHSPDDGVASAITVLPVDPRSLPTIMGELPFAVARFEEHRSGIELDDFDAVAPLKALLLEARQLHRERFPGSLERPGPQALRTLLDFARKLSVPRGKLIPDSYTLTVAAKGVVGNDFALTVLQLVHRYPYNGELVDPDPSQKAPEPEPWETSDDEEPGFLSMSGDRDVQAINRAPGSAFHLGRLRLERRPDPRRSREWARQWEPGMQCSWPAEDLVIESFRDYVGKRALSLARVGMLRSEPFTTSFLDGIDLRESLRDVKERRIHVREEPRFPGAVGALVLIFEEDDFGVRYPWRTTWMAEHRNESTLAFYATDFMDNVIGPGIARAHYGGCMLIFPPRWVPDIWEDLRFERAKTPSERLLLAAIYWCQDHFIVHVAARPASPEVKAEARARGKHILHLPLATFSTTTLERLRRVHVLNDHKVRTWAHRFIR